MMLALRKADLDFLKVWISLRKGKKPNFIQILKTTSSGGNSKACNSICLEGDRTVRSSMKVEFSKRKPEVAAKGVIVEHFITQRSF